MIFRSVMFHRMVHQFMKYDSATKEYRPIVTAAFGGTTDAIVFKDKYETSYSGQHGRCVDLVLCMVLADTTTSRCRRNRDRLSRVMFRRRIMALHRSLALLATQCRRLGLRARQ